MNAFYEHPKDSIRFGYRCFDRLLLNGLIQPFQQPERGIGFFNTYRQQYPVSRDVLREIASQFQNWAINRSQKWARRFSTHRKTAATSSSIHIFGKRSRTRWWRL